VTTVEKPWGREIIWAKTQFYVGKILVVNDGQRLSLQYHKNKTETMMVLTGVVKATLGDSTIMLQPYDNLHIEPNTIHRIEAVNGQATLVEVSTPELDDVVRIADDFNR
jgi:mannose-6-phosphate isomerase-like protein (cupin superfamily)